MVTLDRRKLTAPILAQAAAFVVVLAIGSVTGHSPMHPNGPLSPSTSPPASVRTTPPGNTSTARSTELSVVIDQGDGFGVVMPNVTVEVSKDNRALTLVLPAAHLAEGVAGTPVRLGSVPAGHEYQVCADPPPDWTFTDNTTGARPRWDCLKVDATSAAQTVTFHLLPPLPSAGTVP